MTNVYSPGEMVFLNTNDYVNEEAIVYKIDLIGSKGSVSVKLKKDEKIQLAFFGADVSCVSKSPK